MKKITSTGTVLSPSVKFNSVTAKAESLRYRRSNGFIRTFGRAQFKPNGFTIPEMIRGDIALRKYGLCRKSINARFLYLTPRTKSSLMSSQRSCTRAYGFISSVRHELACLHFYRRGVCVCGCVCALTGWRRVRDRASAFPLRKAAIMLNRGRHKCTSKISLRWNRRHERKRRALAGRRSAALPDARTVLSSAKTPLRLKEKLKREEKKKKKGLSDFGS